MMTFLLICGNHRNRLDHALPRPCLRACDATCTHFRHHRFMFEGKLIDNGCEDKNEKCAWWAEIGYCQNNPWCACPLLSMHALSPLCTAVGQAISAPVIVVRCVDSITLGLHARTLSRVHLHACAFAMRNQCVVATVGPDFPACSSRSPAGSVIACPGTSFTNAQSRAIFAVTRCPGLLSAGATPPSPRYCSPLVA